MSAYAFTQVNLSQAAKSSGESQSQFIPLLNCKQLLAWASNEGANKCIFKRLLCKHNSRYDYKSDCMHDLKVTCKSTDTIVAGSAVAQW